MKLILGSESKTRRGLMVDYGYEHECMSADIDEKAIRDTDPEKLVLMISHAKADAILPNIKEEALLITSDQVIAFHGEIREKPENEAEARVFLESYRNDRVSTVSGLVVTNTKTGERFEGVDIASVYMSNITDEAIQAYIESKRPFILAGGFGVQDELLLPFIEKVDGEMESVMGLSKILLKKLLSDAKYV